MMKHECQERNPTCLCNKCKNDSKTCCEEHNGTGCPAVQCVDFIPYNVWTSAKKAYPKEEGYYIVLEKYEWYQGGDYKCGYDVTLAEWDKKKRAFLFWDDGIQHKIYRPDYWMKVPDFPENETEAD